MNTIYKKAQQFIYRNARPLDLARWQYHFENGSKDAVLKALSYYQNEDGGFGHALEADSWNPCSAPIQTWAATEILHEIKFTDDNHPIIKGIQHYLESGQSFDGRLWFNIIESNNDHPHAPWWHSEGGSKYYNDYNPTACLAGFIIRFSDKCSEPYKLGCRIAQEAFLELMSSEKQYDMHTILCYIRLMEYLEDSSTFDIIDIEALRNKLKEQVTGCITRNTDQWETSYICKPSQFFNSKDSIFYSDNMEIVEYECDYMINTQLDDGSWNITWSWSDFPNEWAISKNWWKSNGIIMNMLFLRGFDKI